ncbi:MAG: membrane-bound PQQ-dependent dehydrogenase, glucose/quinate/shikimate family [Halothiobacillus sp.]|jgi:quinoprotein glucose dehydrogenase|nr:membrane-bound PQQ-dependent dehydrogenase, glucose/quinate/shikimate family [Halothiobacillus sp.]
MQHITKGLVAGFAATLILSALMVMKAMMGVMPALDLPGMIAGMMGAPNMSAIGWAVHFMIGIVLYGVAIALLGTRLPGNSHIGHGLMLGAIGWFLMMVMLMPMAGAGLFGLNLGIMAPMMTLVLHLIFGGVLGWVYGRQAHTVTASQSVELNRTVQSRFRAGQLGMTESPADRDADREFDERSPASQKETAVTDGRGVAVWAVKLLGLLILLLGVTLAAGGGWLVVLGGSPYYVLTGLALSAAGALIFRMKALGAGLYAGVFVLSVIWAIWEVGLNGWALLPRVLALAILMGLVIASLPVLLRTRSWRVTASSAAVFVVLAFTGIATVALADRDFKSGQMPTGTGAQTSDPSLRQTGTDWPAYGGTYGAQRYSPLTQIDRDNVQQLERAWIYRTGDLPEEKWGAETTPLKIGDDIYLCSARNILIALDAETGQERWRHDPGVSDEYIPYTAACRGVAYFELPAGNDQAPRDEVFAGVEPCAARIIEGTLDARLIAVDAQTGERCSDFGENGEVDITRGMGDVYPGMVSITSAPTIVRGVVITGHQVLDGQKRNAPSGVVQGFDAVSGVQRWAWDMTQPELTGRPPAGQTYTRGTPNMWTTASGDEQLGLVYLPLGNSAADYYSTDRSEAENEYATSLVALDVTTGKPAWSFQTVHVDVWDYDLGSQGTLVDFPTAAGIIPAIILPSKQGDMYVLDRRTGIPLTQVEEIAVPQGGVEPDERSSTQPISKFHTLRKADLTERDMWGMSPVDQLYCRIAFRRATYEGFYTPPTTDTHWIQYPGYNGGSDWGGVAVDVQRGVIIANYNDMPNFNRLVSRAEANELGWFPRGDPRHAEDSGEAEGAGAPQLGVPYAVNVNAGWQVPFTGLLCKQPPYGGIRAIDLTTGMTLWDRPLGTARNNGPFGIPSRLPFNIGTPNNGGSVVTAGGLIFIAAATDDLIRAIDIETGETLWTDVLPAGGQANPVVYESGGRQYLVIMAGGHHFMKTARGDYLVAYTLPEKADNL